jgi:membrane protease YdiL (CAAX protease family)
MSYFEHGLLMAIALPLSFEICRWAFQRFAGGAYAWNVPSRKELKEASKLFGPKFETPAGLITTAIRFIVGTAAITFMIGLSVVLAGIIRKAPLVSDFTVKTLLVFVAEIVLVATAVAAGRSVGKGDINVGLANTPISQRRVMLILAIAIAAYAALANYIAYLINPDLLIDKEVAPNPWAAGWYFSIAVVVAPVAEELFFRGWLWTGLRRHWSALRTATVTAAFWLALHFGFDIARDALVVPGLVPVAVILSAAREFAGSVRAPIILHAVYNLTVTGVVFILLR